MMIARDAEPPERALALDFLLRAGVEPGAATEDVAALLQSGERETKINVLTSLASRIDIVVTPGLLLEAFSEVSSFTPYSTDRALSRRLGRVLMEIPVVEALPLIRRARIIPNIHIALLVAELTQGHDATRFAAPLGVRLPWERPRPDATVDA